MIAVTCDKCGKSTTDEDIRNDYASIRYFVINPDFNPEKPIDNDNRQKISKEAHICPDCIGVLKDEDDRRKDEVDAINDKFNNYIKEYISEK